MLHLLFGTRRRMLIGAVVALVISVAVGQGVTLWIRGYAADVGNNLLLIVTWVACLMASAILQGCLFGDILWGERWRRRTLLGWDPSAEELTVEDVKDRSFPMYALMGLLIALNYGGHSAATGNFFGWYNYLGFYVVQLRSEDPAQRLEGLAELREHDNPGVSELLAGLLDDPVSAVRAEAMGIMGDRKHIPAREKLLRALEGDDEKVRGTAAEALGKLGGAGVIPALHGLLSRGGSTEVRRGALAGLGIAKAKDSGAVMARFLTDEAVSPEVRATAAWALGEAAPANAAEALMDAIDSTGVGLDRCAAIHAYAKLSNGKAPGISARYKAAFNVGRGKKGFGCERGFITERAKALCFVKLNRPSDVPYEGECIRFQLSSPERFRVKMVRAGARAAANKAMRWLARVNNDEGEPATIRNWAGELYLKLKGY